MQLSYNFFYKEKNAVHLYRTGIALVETKAISPLHLLNSAKPPTHRSCDVPIFVTLFSYGKSSFIIY